MIHLTLEGKINGFKSLAISKIIHLALVTLISADIINLSNTIQKKICLEKQISQNQYETLCKNYEQVGLKSVNIFSKIVSLQSSWIQKLYDNRFHEWKIVPLNLLNRYLGNNFHSNVLLE